ncbi:MAG: hypothetical protein ACOX5T_07205 [Candidatus Cryptobacteroides sp.]
MKNSYIIFKSLLASLATILVLSCSGPEVKERPQWTEKQAWEWDRKVGIIKGFNQPEPAYPGMDLEQIISRMSELGFNSVRAWNGGNTAEEQVEKIREMADIAEKYGMTVSPVLYLHRNYLHRDAPEEQNLADAEKCVRTVVRPFKDDPRIIMWDIWNEPVMDTRDSVNLMKEMDWIEKAVHWCREEMLSQPITASIFWDTDMNSSDVSSKYFLRRVEVENMMDLHNFHDYMCSENFGEDVRVMIDKMKSMSNRPLVCTECLTRVNGSGVGRTLAEFATKHVHFYIWGSYANDANWEVKWGNSTYDPYEPMFHNIMYSDGDLIDAREIEYIKNFKFTDSVHEADPGLEITERWTHERAWRRMSLGPIKGLVGASAPLTGYNSLNVKLELSEFMADENAFYAKLDSQLSRAAAGGYTLLLTLLTDADADASLEDIGRFVGDVTWRYYCSPVVQAWDLYYHPGETVTDTDKVSRIIDTVFRYARNSYTNQPLTSTPYVRVKPFPADFDYWGALVHGRRNGWNWLDFSGGSTPELVAKIWGLSDVVSFSTDQPQAEAGWLLSICFRYGRPIFCTMMASPSREEASKTLDRFAKSHVFWYASQPVNAAELSKFAFIPIVTERVTNP